MGRWTQYDEDDYRLPEGMKRIGYDADTQTYTFRDADGSIWESGQQYGKITRVGQRAPSPAAIASKARRDSMFAPSSPDDVHKKTRRDSTSARRSRSPSPSTGFRERFGYNPDTTVKVRRKPVAKSSSADSTNSGAAQKCGKSDDEDRVVSSTPVGSLAHSILSRDLSGSGTASTNFADIVPAKKTENGVSRNRSVSSPMGLLRRAMTVVSTTASPKGRPERGGTKFEALKKAKVMEVEKEMSESESGSEDEKEVKTRPSRLGRGMSVRRYIEHGPDGEKKGSFGRRKSVKW